jgi:uncharacterized membrane protein YcaP (DUF421 family)
MEALNSLLGSGREATELTVLQVVLRAVVVFFISLAIVRIANKRFFARKTAFDYILGFILASMLARAINGSEQLGPTIAAGFTLALLHRGLGWLACWWPALSGVIKGHSQTLIEHGEVNKEELERHHIGEDDLAEELRLKGIESPAEAKRACLERSGEISVIKS